MEFGRGVVLEFDDALAWYQMEDPLGRLDSPAGMVWPLLRCCHVLEAPLVSHTIRGGASERIAESFYIILHQRLQFALFCNCDSSFSHQILSSLQLSWSWLPWLFTLPS